MDLICVIGRPGVVVVVIAVSGVGTVAAIAAAGLGFKIEVVEGDGGGADNGQEDKAIGQEGGVHCYQAGGEVDENSLGSASASARSKSSALAAAHKASSVRKTFIILICCLLELYVNVNLFHPLLWNNTQFCYSH